MMSEGDGPGVATAAAAVATSLPSGGEENANTGDNSEMKHVWKFIYIDLSFVKSLYGIFIAAELILSLLGLISVSVPKNEGCAYLHSSSYSYYEFTASSCFIVSLVWYILYALAITKKLGFIRWDIAEIVWIGFYLFNYLIGSCVMIAKACGQGGYKAAATMISCWLCSKTFLNKTALNAHLTSKEHRRQTVICVWCTSIPRENTFTKPGDLANHCRQYHFKETKNLSKTFFSISNCFYFSVFPNDYAAITSKVENWTSPNAIEARGLVQRHLEHQPGAAVKFELWQQGWKSALNTKVKKKGSHGAQEINETKESTCKQKSIECEVKDKVLRVEQRENDVMKSGEPMEELKDVREMRKDDEYESDRRVTENVLELEELKQSERQEVNKNEVMTNRNETIENDTDICIKEKEKEVDIENRVTRDKLDTDEMKQYDPETEEKQEIKEQIRDKDENESHDSVPEMKYREIIKEHKSDNVHKPKKHKHKSKRSHDDNDRKMKKVKTKKMKTEIKQNETRENLLTTPKQCNVNVKNQEERNQEETIIVNKTPVRYIAEFENYVKDLKYDPNANKLSSGEETPLLDENMNVLERELELVSEILAKDNSNTSRINSSINETKNQKRVKISYEEYKAKKIDIKVSKNLGSGKKVEGEERIVNEKGDSIRVVQGEDNIWRRITKPDVNLTNKEQEKEIDNVKEMKEKNEIIDTKLLDKETEINKTINYNTNHKVDKRGSSDQESAEGETECSNTGNQTDQAFANRAINILKSGVMPFCPPARRQWDMDTQINIPVGDINMIWPPKGWSRMTSDRQLLITENMAMTLEGCFYGKVDTEMSRGYLLDKYNYLILPGANHHYKEPNEIAATKSRYYTYQVMKEIANGKKPGFAEQQQLGMLELLLQNQVLPYDPKSISVPLRLGHEKQPMVLNSK